MSDKNITAALRRWMATTIDGENKHEWHRDMHAAIAEIERLTAERDEWQHKWMALAQASLLVGTMRNPEQKASEP